MKSLMILDGYIVGVCEGSNLIVTSADTNEIERILIDKPLDPKGYTYRLRADILEWELAELPPASDPMEEDIAAEEALSQIQEVLGYEA